MKRSGWPGIAGGGFGLLTGIGLAWILAGSTGPQPAWGDVTSTAGRSLLVEPTTDGGQVLYILDNAQQMLTVYQYDPRKGKLRLSAARHLSADQQLLEFNNEEPHVSDIEKLARQR